MYLEHMWNQAVLKEPVALSGIKKHFFFFKTFLDNSPQIPSNITLHDFVSEERLLMLEV